MIPYRDAAPAAAVSAGAVTVELGGERILEDVDIEVAPGQWAAVVGPNGAGKSTLLRVLAGLQRFRGEVDIGGTPVSAASRRVLAQTVALVPQIPVIPPGMTVYDYVLLGRTPHLDRRLTVTGDDERIAAVALDRLDLMDLASRAVGSLSGGERQRVVVARALTQTTPVLLLDEPTGSLDLGRQQDVLELVDELRSERCLTVVMTMHDLTLAAQFAERLTLIDGGRISAAGTPREVLQPERLAAVYGAGVAVIDDPRGPIVVPRRRS